MKKEAGICKGPVLTMCEVLNTVALTISQFVVEQGAQALFKHLLMFPYDCTEGLPDDPDRKVNLMMGQDQRMTLKKNLIGYGGLYRTVLCGLKVERGMKPGGQSRWTDCASRRDSTML